ncbi:MAG: Tad domain-containing protein [Endomicrobia bacterium]|nr:Tad domain-containing protein [Endomicrobiia bacterium]MCL2507046.1 Tad domain-containing protein [Endomicrobiia bacterium]
MNNRGQTLYYFLVFTLILVISWAMMLNIAKLIRDRMAMQNAVDNAALSLAVHKARTMNFVGNVNYLIGSLLSLGTDPFLVQMPSYNTDIIAAYITGDLASGFHKEKDEDVARLKGWVDKLQDLQEEALELHLAYGKAIFTENLFKGYFLKMPGAYSDFSLESAEKYFGIKRNKKGIKYLKTVNTTINKIHIVYNPYPAFADSALQDVLKDIFPAAKVLSELGNLYNEYVPKKKHYEKPYSWYVVDEENFYKQKIKISMTKYKEDKSDKPLFSGLLKIVYPQAMTVYSAAAIYNTKGTMFPDKEDTNTGIPDSMVRMSYNVLFLAKTGEFIKSLHKAKVPPKIIGVVAAAITAERYARYLKAFKNKNNPINAYNDAKEGGWGAHLVPYKSSENEQNENN